MRLAYGVFIKPKERYCINCDNRHGCKSGAPPCITEMTENNVANMPGKQYLIEKDETDKCRGCPFFRSCWKTEEYNRLSK